LDTARACFASGKPVVERLWPRVGIFDFGFSILDFGFSIIAAERLLRRDGLGQDLVQLLDQSV
jgi:hypothetical protein